MNHGYTSEKTPITQEIDMSKTRSLDSYMCNQPFNWFKINSEEFPITLDRGSIFGVDETLENQSDKRRNHEE